MAVIVDIDHETGDLTEYTTTVPGTVNEIIGTDPVAETETRRIIVRAIYSDGLPVTGYYDYSIRNLER